MFWSCSFCPLWKCRHSLQNPCWWGLLPSAAHCYPVWSGVSEGLRSCFYGNFYNNTCIKKYFTFNINAHLLDEKIFMYETHCCNALLLLCVWGFHRWMTDRQQSQWAPEHRPIPLMDKHWWIISTVSCAGASRRNRNWHRLICVSPNTPMNNKRGPWVSLWCAKKWLCSI